MILLILLQLLLITSFCNTAPQRIQFKDVNNYYPNNLSVIDNNNAPSIDDLNVMIALLINNHAYSLPTFLATLETLKCPNAADSKCQLWVLFENCNDDSKDIFISWLSTTRPLFDKIIMIDTKSDAETKKKHPELSATYFSSNLKKRAIQFAIDNKYTHVFFLSADVVLRNDDTLNILLRKKKPVVAPLLKSFSSAYSTYWSANDFFAEKILKRELIGCFKVTGVRDCYLVDLKNPKVLNLLKADESVDYDDLAFSNQAIEDNLLLHVCNREEFGYIPTLDKETKEERIEEYLYLKMEHLLNGPNKTYNEPLPVTAHMDKTLIEKTPTKLGFDKIYIINLERRSDRRERIELALNELNIEYKIFNAIDAKKIDEEYIKSLGIEILPNYTDPYHPRSLNYGEISCFLSHYFIWKEAVENKYKKIIILEDDARFALKFKRILIDLVKQMSTNKIDWELMYLGRKIMRNSKDEAWIDGIQAESHGILKPGYAHWTVAYALTLNGAKKLFDQQPLKKLVPVDEYLPIMYDQQPNEYWASFFSPRNLKTYAIQPFIVTPTHYFGEPNYISDTEDTTVINKDLFEAKLNNNPLKTEYNSGDINSNQEIYDRHIEL